ncbi:DUF6275 family protein [Fructilactobacillus myrtifloralis]|uniref:DUF6275 family protein n=1 Tax=Fructilactobacillus myrtifloralis TaxID=2940301 RepID=A0ABY5BN25_9LACO|nr:DUF6275 family protein [Fructilactobacillus myrtifloralis]USS85064.1 DUF6275 family protein [Fructilactobacillus myrtifloralis]
MTKKEEIIEPSDYDKLAESMKVQQNKGELIMDMDFFLQLASNEIWKHYCTFKNKESGLATGRPFVIWSCKALQNFKAVLGVPGSNKWLFEVTFNGDKNAIYLDSYEKTKNEAISLELAKDRKILEDENA